MEVPRLGVELELQLQVYTTATAMQDPSLICNLHHSSWQCRILNPLSEGRDRTYDLRDRKLDSFPMSHDKSVYFKRKLKGIPFVAQWVKDQALSLQWLRLLLWCGFDH